jgi:AraC family transcriptional regulator of adaptative response/methylated-DNA-[protein]-cysteine methyltransferase
MLDAKRAKSAYANAADRWAAVTGREREADGHFYYGVRTTGVYCRPSCPSRTAHRKNVVFFNSGAEAVAAGFRACMRCHPDEVSADQRYATLVVQACRLIDSADQAPSLDELAAAVGMSKHYFHRIFRKFAGVTPKAYAVARRDKKIRDGLKSKGTVTEVIYAAGFNSSGRFYETSREVLGMTPTRRRAGGAGETIRFALGECSLGTILVGATDQGVCSILLGDTPEELLQMFQEQFPKAELVGGDADFDAWIAQVVAFIDMPGSELKLPMDIRGTAFQQRVWKALGKIPRGQTASYAAIAKEIGAPKSTRAVAQACGANKLAVVIPCHRVVRSDGGLSGYRWGVERKRALLDREKPG